MWTHMFCCHDTEVIWKPVTPCKYHAVFTRLHATHQNVCLTFPSDRAATPWKKKHSGENTESTSIEVFCNPCHLYFSFIFKRKGTFHFCRLLRDTYVYACVYVWGREKEIKNRREKIRLRTWPRQLKGPNRQKINHKAFRLPPDMAQTHQLPHWCWLRTVHVNTSSKSLKSKTVAANVKSSCSLSPIWHQKWKKNRL